MSQNDKDCNCICGVDCAVSSCKYHTTDDCCCAGSIKVKSETAAVKGETFCGTFTPRTTW